MALSRLTNEGLSASDWSDFPPSYRLFLHFLPSIPSFPFYLLSFRPKMLSFTSFFFSLTLPPIFLTFPSSPISLLPTLPFSYLSCPYPHFLPFGIVTKDYQILNSGSSLKTIGSDVVITAGHGAPCRGHREDSINSYIDSWLRGSTGVD